MIGETLSQFLTLQPADLILVMLGVIIGFVFGFLPGLGATQAIALLIPLTYTLAPERALLLLMSVAGATPFGGSVSAILLNTPGTPVNVATSWDGYPLAQSGKAGMALGASATASGLGALVGVAVLLAILPIGRLVVLSFSYPEYFAMALAGLCVLVVMEQRELWKGLMSLALGMLLASIGYDPVTGGVRLTFGVTYLWDGIKLIPALIGLFAISEGLKLTVQEAGMGSTVSAARVRSGYRDVFQGALAVLRNWGLFLQSSIVGVIIGIIPGIGGAVSNVLAYSLAVQTSKEKESFGKGDIRGVIAPEAANNSKDGGGLVPTILFGIPGTAEMAILLGALVLHGVTPGPRMVEENMSVVYALVVALVLSNIITSTLGIILAPFLSRVPAIPNGILGALIIILGATGAYATELNFNDSLTAIIFGVSGYFLSRFGFSRVAIVMALVLGEIMQTNFFLTVDTMGPLGFILRPIALVLILLCLLITATSFRHPARKSEAGAAVRK